MSKSNGRYKRLVEFNEIGGDKEKKKMMKKQSDGEGNEEHRDTDSAIEDEEKLEKEKVKELSNRARVLARSDYGLFFIGSIGAILAGIIYPGWGVVFAFMIEVSFFAFIYFSLNSFSLFVPSASLLSNITLRSFKSSFCI